MLHTKFEASEKEVLNQKIFEYFSLYFYGSNTGSPGPGPFEPVGHHLSKVGKRTTRQCHILDLIHLSKMALK